MAPERTQGSRTTREPRFRVYIALSADGLIADAEGGVGWLQAFEGVDYGYTRFLRDIGTVVMGRRSFDQCLGFAEWPYPEIPSVVLSHRSPPTGVPQGVRFAHGPVATVASSLLAESRGKGGDVWIMGGADVVRQFTAAGLVDEAELFVIPTQLGRGVSLFADNQVPAGWMLEGSRVYPNGVVRHTYRAQPAATSS